MSYHDPAKVIAKLLATKKSAWGVDDIVTGDNREPVAGRTGIIVSATPSPTHGVGQTYVVNIIVYCPDTTTRTTIVKDGVDKAFALAGKISQFFREYGTQLVEDHVVIGPEVTPPGTIDDPLSDKEVVTFAVDVVLLQGV